MTLSHARAAALLASALSLTLAGCSAAFTAPISPTVPGLAISGAIHGGQQPVAGAHVFLYAAGTAGTSSASRSMLAAPGYVVSGPTGGFSITGDYTCQPGDLVFLVAVGGNPGLAPGTNNPALAMETGLGTCATLNAGQTFQINEVTTVATVFALNGFESGLASVGSNNTPAAKLGLLNAFSMIGNLVDVSTGLSRASVPNGATAVPLTEINTLANILASCINTDGTGTPCNNLFDATTATFFPPTDTISALVAVANSPGSNVATLYSLSTANAPFQPALTTAPNDFSIAVVLSGLGFFSASSVAIDSFGNAWLPRNPGSNNGGVIELSPSGQQLSPLGGFSGGGVNSSTGVAIDPANNVWVSNLTEDYFALAVSPSSGSISKLSNNGTPLSPATGFQNGTLLRPHTIAVDGTGAAWATEDGSGEIKLSNTGTFLSDAPGFNHGGRFQGFPSIDLSNNFWVPNRSSDSVAELNPAGAVLSFQYPTDPSTFGAESTAFDHAGNIWVGGARLTKLSNTGQRLSPVGGYGGGGIGTSTGTGFPYALAIDGSGTVFALVSTNVTGNSNVNNHLIAAFNNNGLALSPPTGYQSRFLFQPLQLAVDGSGNLWVADDGQGAVVFVGIATPVVTPLALGIQNGTLATRP